MAGFYDPNAYAGNMYGGASKPYKGGNGDGDSDSEDELPLLEGGNSTGIFLFDTDIFDVIITSSS